MNISVISTKKDVKEFHRLPFIINKNNKYWIPHIKQDVETIFNPKKIFSINMEKLKGLLFAEMESRLAE